MPCGVGGGGGGTYFRMYYIRVVTAEISMFFTEMASLLTYKTIKMFSHITSVWVYLFMVVRNNFVSTTTIIPQFIIILVHPWISVVVHV